MEAAEERLLLLLIAALLFPAADRASEGRLGLLLLLPLLRLLLVSSIVIMGTVNWLSSLKNRERLTKTFQGQLEIKTCHSYSLNLDEKFAEESLDFCAFL